MKLVKSLLLGSAAGLAAVAGAQAADLPVRKAAPVEYVRVCTAYGAGFFFIPGTDTCLRVSGRARFEYTVAEVTSRRNDVSGMRAIGRIGLDARTATAYGTLRTFVRVDIARRTGFLTTGTGFRTASVIQGVNAAGGILQGSEYSNVQTQVVLDQAYVQLAGFTAGRTDSFFDFFPTYPNFIGTIGSVATTTGFWYTAALGSGIDLTVGIEDPTERKFSVAGSAFGTAIDPATGLLTNVGTFAGTTPGPFGVTLLSTQAFRMPDIVAALRVTQPWGNFQLSAVVHQIFPIGSFNGTTTVGVPTVVPPAAGFTAIPTAVPITGTGAPGFAPDSEYGFAIQAGVKVNLPMLAAGDALLLAAAYSDGASSYVLSDFVGQPGLTSAGGTSGRIPQFSTADAVVDGFGNLRTTESYMVRAGLLHYWTPTLRSGFQVGYGRINYDDALRNPFFGVRGGTGLGVAGAAAGIGIFDSTFRDTNLYVAAANLIWSPVRDLDIGVEVLYTRADPQGRVIDINDGVTAGFGNTATVASFGGIFLPAVSVPGVGLVPVKTRSYDDNFQARFRVQRDF